jgi:hypothetical protein
MRERLRSECWGWSPLLLNSIVPHQNMMVWEEFGNGTGVVFSTTRLGHAIGRTQVLGRVSPEPAFSASSLTR